MSKCSKMIVGFLSLSFLFCFALSGDALAIDANSISSKATLEGVYQCIQEGAFRASFKASAVKDFILDKSSEDKVKLPYNLTDAKDNNMNCEQVMFGWLVGGVNSSPLSSVKLNNGLLPANVQDGDYNTIKEYFSGSEGEGGSGTMGYEATAISDSVSSKSAEQLILTNIKTDDQCLGPNGDRTRSAAIRIVFPAIAKVKTGEFLLWDKYDSSANVADSNVPAPGSGESKMFTGFCSDSTITVTDIGSSNAPSYSVFYNYQSYIYDGIYDKYVQTSEATSFEVYANEGSWFYLTNNVYYSSKVENIEIVDSNEYSDWGLMYSGSNVVNTIIKKLNTDNAANVKVGSLNDYNSLKLDPQEIYDLYTYYINDVYKIKVVCEGENDYDLYTEETPINWISGKECRAYTSSQAIETPSEKVYGVDDEHHFTATIGGYSDVIDMLKTLDLSALTAKDSGTLAGGTETEESTEQQKDPCYDSSGSLGWILCPIVEKVQEFLADAYEKCVEPFLIVNTNLLDTTENQGTYGAWQIFVNIANVLMVIMLLIVIFSQLTGVGVTNYGIKKTLPKLILVAILINLSFIICQLAVDLSNILGSSLNNLLSSMGAGLIPPEAGISDFSGGGWFRILLDSVLVAGGVALATSTMTTILSGGALAGLILPIVLALVSALVSVLFFFILLGIRQAAVVILVVVSPLAFVCYMLPNTKKLFDKWLDLFKKMLLIYPMAGLIIGACNLVTAILTSSGGADDFLILLVSMLLMVLPFFLIPSMIKGSMNALGMVTSKLNGFGQKFGGRVKGGLGKANELPSMKARQQKAAEDQQQRIDRALNKVNARRAKKLNAKVDRKGQALSRVEADELKRINDKVKGGEALTQQEQKTKAALEKKQTGLNEKQRAQLASANTGVLDYQRKQDNYRLNANAAVMTGTRAKDAMSAEKAERDAMDFHRNYFEEEGYEYTDKDGNKQKGKRLWTRLENGDYATTGPDGKKEIRRASDIAKMTGRTVSHAEALLNQDVVNRAEQAGKLGAFAVGGSTINAAANAANIAGLQSSQDSLINTIQAGSSEVLKINHDKAQEQRRQVQIDANEGYVQKSDDALRLEAMERNNATEGKNTAVAEAAARTDGGLANVAKSAEANRQNVEGQLINTIAGNQAADNANARLSAEQSAEQFNQAVAVNAQKLDNANIMKNIGTEAYFENMADLSLDNATARENVKNLATKKMYQEAADNSMKIPAPDRSAIFAAAESKQSAEALASEMSKIKARASLPKEDKNYLAIDNDKYAEALGDLLNKPVLTDGDQLEAKAFMSLLASGGGYGQKKLASVVAGATQGEFAAKFMSKDSTISSAINTKSPALAQYMREINNGSTTASFDDWMKASRDGFSGTNAQFVVEKIADKDENLVGQADGSFEDLLNAGAIPQERLSAIYNNRDVYNSATDGVRRMIANKLGRPYDQAEYNGAGGQPSSAGAGGATK